ncbi:nitrous oxide reductase maturation protein NosD [Halalkaliarchaeum desulfuricum]|uniref:Nitrous oxide reductase maturation protein NosD n=1 Tax=Halalkaliarchaeum desulfuricum TaxID=2055893 RepID=A0A343TF84_9EURY|nr:NosD domain-containing protein [Halalkaliarchaeum desulfuricum]AUX07756.1 nitrous oxide reductase maturation protein NosD [Halalkaliarchaeum desulfuricum]
MSWSTPRSLAVAGIVLALLFGLGTLGLFVVDAGATETEPVPFDETVTVGLTSETAATLDENVSLPRVQVFYSQYRYVTGYYGVGTYADVSSQPGHDAQFGYPMAVHVTDYAGTGIRLDEDGYPAPMRTPGWVAADEAVYVVESDARSPDGGATVPFSNRGEAEAFVHDHGGEVVDWETALDRSEERSGAESVRKSVDDRRVQADTEVDSRTQLLDEEARPVSVVVGEDADTIQAAVDAAEPNTTVVVPPGTYEEHVEIDRPITLVGVDGNGSRVHLSGDGNGTVIRITADRAAVAGVAISGVGNETRDPDAVPTDAWDANVELGYGHGDAGIAAVDAADVLIAGVAVDTPANGILLRDSPGAVVRDVDVVGADEWLDGFMGVMVMRSPAVVENSTFAGGRDGVYTHRSHGAVVRNNSMDGMRYGVHLMHTDDALIADNVVRGGAFGGITIMTDPAGNAIVGNDVTNSSTGISPSGSDVYVAENVLVDNDRGMSTATRTSLYEHNVLANNDVGARVSSILPTNRIVANDFVGNERHVYASGIGPLRIWTHDGAGNYWDGALGDLDGVNEPGDATTLSREYVATDPVDERLGRTAGATTLARSPAVGALRSLSDAVPGLKTGGVVDVAPRGSPANPEVLERAKLLEWIDDTETAADTGSEKTEDRTEEER